MFRSRRAAEIAGLTVGNLATGLSFGWWVDKHNRHHANPNHEDHDPDVGEGVIVWTEKQAAKRTGFGRWMARNQARIFFPLLTLEGLNLHVSSISDAITLLHYVPVGSELQRGIQVLKMRGSDHDKALRRFRITDRGMEVEGPFAEISRLI